MKHAVRVALLTLTAAGLCAADEEAPLANAKKELQQLQKDEAVKRSGAGNTGLKGVLPSLNAPVPGQAELELSPPKPTGSTLEKGQTAGPRNWLVDGFDQLDRTAQRRKAGMRKEESADADGPLPDRSDLNYLLRVYEKQQRERLAEDEKAGRLSGSGKSTTADPLAPFLQNWLAGSPVRGPILEALNGRDGTGAVRDGFAVSETSQGLGDAVSTSTAGAAVTGNAADLAGVPSVNPYLQGLALPSPHDNGPVAGAPPVAPADPAALSSIQPLGKTASAGAGQLANDQPSKADSFKPPATRADDDKKYFPQLKRF